MTFKEWNDRSCRLSNALTKMGVKKGDRFAILAYNCVEWLEIYVALARAGLGAVPVWLVSWADMAGALADGDLKMAELASLPSLQMGSAHTFSEMLQPIPTRLPSRLVINAEGTLADGRRFRLHYTSQDDFSGNDVRSVRIDVW